MRILIRVVCLFGLLLLAGAAPAQEEGTVAGALGAELDRYLRGLESFGFAGAAVVARDGAVVLEKGYGVADRETDRAVTSATVFTTGSITKQFTGAAILKLEDSGKLSVDDKIIEYFDDVPPDKQGITIHHLLTHSAGFPGAIGDDFGDDTRDSFLNEVLATELLFEPGAAHEYSNVGYSLAAIIVEIVSGTGYEQFLVDELFTPVGMRRTGYTLPGYAGDEVAVGYRGDRRWGTFIERPSYVRGPSWNLKGNGGIQTTVSDMYRWHLALAGDDLLSPEAKVKYFGRHIDEGFGDSWYGYGWSISDTSRGTTRIAHNGGNSIFSADFHRYVDEDVVVFVTSSSSEFFIDPISRSLAAIVFGEPFTMPPLLIDWSRPGEDPSVLDDYAGTYRLDANSTISVRREGDQLRLAAAGANARNLLIGGVGGTPDERIDTVAARTAEIVNQWIAGDVRGIHQAFGGRRPLAELEGSLANFRRMREGQYGALQSAEVGNVLPADGGLRAYVGMRHADGRAWVIFVWRDGELEAIEPVRELPRLISAVFPTSPTEFTSFDLRSPIRVRIRFEPPTGGGRTLIFSTPVGEVRLTNPVHQ
jgi:CubicO group peptidase (beta-lactamase class C family)